MEAAASATTSYRPIICTTHARRSRPSGPAAKPWPANRPIAAPCTRLVHYSARLDSTLHCTCVSATWTDELMTLAIERMDRAVDAGAQRTQLPDAAAAMAQPGGGGWRVGE